jgi:hypothetical protein
MENETQDETVQEDELKTNNRYKQLSEKVISTAKEKEEAEAQTKKARAEAEALTKERDFYKDFSAKANKYPGANDLQDKIWEKVKLGYETEDAMVSVLNKEGKLTSEPQPKQAAEGGSAQTVFPGEKSLDDMNAQEKMAALVEAEKTGDLVRALRGR